ncbi:MAG: hypothetical protein JXR84_01165 [Anaerolineae bacterium]|nr:hypothetical protein [Anaerolineae bacterium]
MTETFEGWFDSEVKAALAMIRGAEAAKKRATVIMLASATASNTPWARVFETEQACNQRVWYQKWQYKPEIARALELCTEKALALADVEVAAVEAKALKERRKAIAQGSVDALQGLRNTALNANGEDRADYRTAASAMLLALADGDLAARIVLLQKGQALQVDVEGLDALIEHELARVASGGESSVIGPAEGDAEPESGD